jgi:hypothetical protein
MAREYLPEVLSRITPEDGADNSRWMEACEFAAAAVLPNKLAYRESAGGDRFEGARLLGLDARRIRNEWLAEHG